jgi:mono/diheme cytochrome c family protein
MMTPSTPRTIMTFKPFLLPMLILVTQAPAAQAQATTPAQLQKAYEAAAGSPAQVERGRVFFTSRHGAEWSCASCHGQLPTGVVLAPTEL